MTIVITLLLSTAKLVASFSWHAHHNHHVIPATKQLSRLHSQAAPDLEMTGGKSITTTPFVVALTREEGKNNKLKKALESNSKIIQILASSSTSAMDVNEIPCIAHADGPDLNVLGETLSSTDFDYIAITSPEAAKVFATSWIDADRPEVGLVAAVGKATQEALTAYGIDVAFVPSKATAATLVKELPMQEEAINEGRATSLLYPASAKAKDTLQNGLEDRGFVVTRLNTYDTVTASWTQEEETLAKSTNVACFASPSAVKAWLKNTKDLGCPRAVAACIGETSYSACRKNGWKEEEIFYPDKPGIDGWSDSVANALQYLSNDSTSV